MSGRPPTPAPGRPGPTPRRLCALPPAVLLLAGLFVGGCGEEGARGADAPPDGPPSIVIVSLDTFRRDRLGAYGGEAGLTPNLDRFASEAIVFERAWAPSGETLFSHAALFTGRSPSELSSLDYSFDFPEDTPTLAGVLSLYGYQTGASVAGGHLSPAFGLDAGFDRYVVARDWGSLYHTGPDALRWLDALEADGAASDPYLLFVHGYDTHNRYLKPSPWGHAEVAPDDGLGGRIGRKHTGSTQVAAGYFFPEVSFSQLFSPDRPRAWDEDARELALRRGKLEGLKLQQKDHDYLRGLYDGAARYADAQFGALMAGLEARGALDEAILIVLADHGEELGEVGLYNHRPGLSEAILRVPLMVRLPGGAGGGRRIAESVSLVDLAPTLIEAAGAVQPAELRGRSLWAALRGAPLEERPVFAETSFRQVGILSGDSGLIFSGLTANHPHLPQVIAAARLDGPAFDGWGDADPGSLRAALIEHRGALPVATSGQVISDERRRILQEGGYW